MLFMKKFWNKPVVTLGFVLLWAATLILTGLWSMKHLPFQGNFPYYNTDLILHYSRAISIFGHFDGIHYLRLVHFGYDDTGSQAFFPLYPFIIRLLTFGHFDALMVAVIFNASVLLISLWLLSRTLKITDLSKFLLLFLTFPVSFFLVVNYTETLFIFLVILFFILLNRQDYFWAAVIAGLASATRVVGIFLALALLAELIQSKQRITRLIALFTIGISGLMIYCYFLFSKRGDPLMFVHVQSMFGAGRSGSAIVLLPQVLYRYVHMLMTTPILSLGFARSAWELGTFTLACLALFSFWRKLTLPALVFCAGAILFPSLSGTLSSFPRYALVVIPLFIATIESLSWKSLTIIAIIQYVMLTISVALFVQGVFVA